MLHAMDHALLRYSNPEATRRDISRTIEKYLGLTWKLEPFVFNSGASLELINIQGTIPVTYKGTVYNFPICIWLMDTHPNVPPICFVKPTADMQIKVSMYVDHSGKIYLPYLHSWDHNSDLIGLIQVMICAFGEHPPVFAKPRSDNTPYPVQPSFMPMPGYPSYSQSPSYPTPPYPNPPYPSQMPTAMRPPPPTPNPRYYPPIQETPAVSAASTGGGAGTITDAHIRESLISALEYKIKQRLNEKLATSKAELDILQHTANELKHGKTKLDNIIEKLKKEKAELERTISILKEKDIELEKAIAEISEQGEVDVDQAVTTTAPLYEQILKTYAEEAALGDAIYYMGEALRGGVIDLEVFLKQIRTLSRKQFMLRALMQKCRQKAGLAC